MPNPKAINVPNLGFTNVQKAVLYAMMNNREDDYSTVEEIARTEGVSAYSYEEVRDAVVKLNRRKFLFEVKKPYGYVYAINKLYISNMEFVYGA